MSDTYDYFHAHAVEAVRKARSMPPSRMKQKQRVVARVYHLLAKECAPSANVHRMNDFRTARRLEQAL
jgi:hypothetical protein